MKRMGGRGGSQNREIEEFVGETYDLERTCGAAVCEKFSEQVANFRSATFHIVHPYTKLLLPVWSLSMPSTKMPLSLSLTRNSL